MSFELFDWLWWLLLLLALLLLLLWKLVLPRLTGGEGEQPAQKTSTAATSALNDPATDARVTINEGPAEQGEEIPPVIYGEEIEVPPGRKYILLLCGDVPVDLRFANHAAPGAAPDFKLGPKAKAEQKGKEICSYPAYDAQTFVAAAWAGLVARYSRKEFIDAGWTLVATRVTSKAAIDTLLSDINGLGPLKLAVHYVGHGDADYTSATRVYRPFLSIVPNSPQQAVQVMDVRGTRHQVQASVPVPGDRGSAARDARYYIDALGAKLRADFSSIEVVLIADGCDMAKSLAERQANLKVLAAVDWLYASVVLGAYSANLHKYLGPECLDTFDAAMPNALMRANQDMRTQDKRVSFDAPKPEIPESFRPFPWQQGSVGAPQEPPVANY